MGHKEFNQTNKIIQLPLGKTMAVYFWNVSSRGGVCFWMVLIWKIFGGWHLDRMEFEGLSSHAYTLSRLNPDLFCF